MSYTIIRVKVPDLPTAFRSGNTNYSNPATKAANIRMIQNINRQYGQIINRWGEVFAIPNGVIIAFIATESGGIMQPPNRFKATGLMQVTPNALWESVKKWKRTTKTDMPKQAEDVLRRQLPEIYSSNAVAPNAAISQKMLNLYQKDANFNILAGTIVLRWLLERFSTMQTGGQLNKAMVAYNAGAYIRPLNISPTNPIVQPIDTLVLATNRLVPLESRNYLYKMLGVDGFLSLIYKDKAI